MRRAKQSRERHTFLRYSEDFGFFFYFDCGQKWNHILRCHCNTINPKSTKLHTIVDKNVGYKKKYS